MSTTASQIERNHLHGLAAYYGCTEQAVTSMSADMGLPPEDRPGVEVRSPLARIIGADATVHLRGTEVETLAELLRDHLTRSDAETPAAQLSRRFADELLACIVLARVAGR